MRRFTNEQTRAAASRLSRSEYICDGLRPDRPAMNNDLPQIVVQDGRSYLKTASPENGTSAQNYRVYLNGTLRQWNIEPGMQPRPDLGFPERHIMLYGGPQGYTELARYASMEQIPAYKQYTRQTEDGLATQFSNLPVVVRGLDGEVYTVPANDASGNSFVDRLAAAYADALGRRDWCVIDSVTDPVDQVEIATDLDLREFVQRGGDPTTGDTLMIAFRPLGDDGLPMVMVDAHTGGVFLRTSAARSGDLHTYPMLFAITPGELVKGIVESMPLGADPAFPAEHFAILQTEPPYTTIGRYESLEKVPLYIEYTEGSRAVLEAEAGRLDPPDTLAVDRIGGRTTAAGGVAAAFVDAAAAVN